jgi:hypothetical protein
MGMPATVSIAAGYPVVVAYVDVRGDIALNAWVGIHKPCTSDVRALFVDAVRDVLLHLGKSML